MFDGLPGDHHHHLHQFIASSRASLPIHLHGNPPSFSAPAAFDDPYQQLIPNTKSTGIDDVKHHLFSTTANLGLQEEEGSSMVPWSSDEVVALLKLRSAIQVSFPDFTWDHVSRKLGELGFKRSPEDCKRKYAEEGKQFHFNMSYSKSYKIFSELDDLYPSDGEAAAQRITDNKEMDQEQVQEIKTAVTKGSGKKKRKLREEEDRFEMLKGFVEGIVGKMMAKQEEMHNKLIEDIVKRDEEKVARELAWKRQEMDRIQMEIEMRAKEQASAGERQATMIEFLKMFETDEGQRQMEDIVRAINTTSSQQDKATENPNPIPPTKSPSPPSPNSAVPTPKTTETHNPSSPSPHSESTANYERGSVDSGKRWPRDEILALINLRCKMNNNNNNNNNEESSKEGAKGPLWERISQGMMELGYKRSAKRCKEKWENINKYFRKTKDSNRKRSVDSRTCPYFHHLSSLYGEGTLLPPN